MKSTSILHIKNTLIAAIVLGAFLDLTLLIFYSVMGLHVDKQIINNCIWSVTTEHGMENNQM